MAISVVLLKSWGQEPRKDGSVVYQEASSSPDLGLSHLLMSNWHTASAAEGLPGTAAGWGRAGARPRPPPAHREPAVQPRGRGVDRAFCGRGAAELKRPRCRTSEAPRRPGGRRRAASSRKKPASRAPPQSVPYLGAERRGDERAAEGQGASRRRRAGPPARRLPTRPARRYLRRRVGATNRKLESARGAAAALSAGRKRARRSPGSGSSRAPPTSPPLPPAGPRERSPQCSDSPEPPPRPGRFSRKRLQLILKEDNAKSNLPLHW
ncbi:translation initiation factor IF-2-like [Felis catus]|uniref:translation initiation factor IF-2-like n=1 Tax=Felis catus TaxID=9685 RepID=UPI001D19EC95|nr:translation initiation factor IF-2-like [Felis catus]